MLTYSHAVGVQGLGFGRDIDYPRVSQSKNFVGMYGDHLGLCIFRCRHVSIGVLILRTFSGTRFH